MRSGEHKRPTRDSPLQVLEKLERINAIIGTKCEHERGVNKDLFCIRKIRHLDPAKSEVLSVSVLKFGNTVNAKKAVPAYSWCWCFLKVGAGSEKEGGPMARSGMESVEFQKLAIKEIKDPSMLEKAER